MKDRPILFKAEMVRAILGGRKSQTRRVIKPQPPKHWPDYFAKLARGHTSLSLPEVRYFRSDNTEVKCPYGQPGDEQGTKFRDSSPPSDGWYWIRWTAHDNERQVWLRRFHSLEDEARDGIPDNDVERWLWGTSPFDDPESVCLDVAEPLDIEWRRPGDRLWVRETWGAVWPDMEAASLKDSIIEYRANLKPGCTDYPGEWPADEARGNPDAPKWRPSIHMPRWASRITLEVTGVRVERVQDITLEDMIAEGATPIQEDCYFFDSYAIPFCKLWDSVNAKRGYSWEQNPWVWIVEFRLEQAQ